MGQKHPLTRLVLLLISISCTSFLYGEAKSGDGFNQKLLVISFDGFRQMYFEDGRVLPWLTKFRQEGVFSDQVQSIFPSETFPNHYSIATGMYAESHGIVANSFYDPALNLTFEKTFLEPYWWDQAEPIWITARKQGKRTAVSFWPGSSVTFPGNMSANYFDYYDKTVQFEKRINEIVAHLANDDVTLAMLYLYQPDNDGHYYGVPSRQVNEQLEKIDNYVGYLFARLEEANLGPDILNIIICADHGMINVTHRETLSNYIDIDNNIERITSYGTVTNVQPKPGKMEDIMEALSSAQTYGGAQFSAYRKTEVPDHYHYSKNDRITDIIIECNLGAYMSPVEPLWLIAGVHGYDPSFAEMRPIFLARGPAFKKGSYRAKKSFTTKDIYAIMAHVIGMKPLETNATLENAMDIFYDGSVDTTTAAQFSTTSVNILTTNRTTIITTTTNLSPPSKPPAMIFACSLLSLLAALFSTFL